MEGGQWQEAFVLQPMFRSCFLPWSKRWPSLPIIITEDSFFPKLCLRCLPLSFKAYGVGKEGKKEGGKEEREEVKEGKKKK